MQLDAAEIDMQSARASARVIASLPGIAMMSGAVMTRRSQ